MLSLPRRISSRKRSGSARKGNGRALHCDRLKLLADVIVAHLELCSICCCRQLLTLRHQAQDSWAGTIRA